MIITNAVKNMNLARTSIRKIAMHMLAKKTPAAAVVPNIVAVLKYIAPHLLENAQLREQFVYTYGFSFLYRRALFPTFSFMDTSWGEDQDILKRVRDAAEEPLGTRLSTAPQRLADARRDVGRPRGVTRCCSSRPCEKRPRCSCQCIW